MSALTTAQKDILALREISKTWNVNKFRAMSQKTIRMCIAVADYCEKNKVGKVSLAQKVLAERESSVKVRKVKEVVEFDKVDAHHTKQVDNPALMIFYETLYDEKPNSKLARTWLLKHGGFADDPEKRARLVAQAG